MFEREKGQIKEKKGYDMIKKREGMKYKETEESGYGLFPYQSKSHRRIEREKIEYERDKEKRDAQKAAAKSCGCTELAGRFT